MAEAEGAYWEGGVKHSKLNGLRRCDTANFEVGMAVRLSDKLRTLTVIAVDHDAGELTVGGRSGVRVIMVVGVVLAVVFLAALWALVWWLT